MNNGFQKVYGSTGRHPDYAYSLLSRLTIQPFPIQLQTSVYDRVQIEADPSYDGQLTLVCMQGVLQIFSRDLEYGGLSTSTFLRLNVHLRDSQCRLQTY